MPLANANIFVIIMILLLLAVIPVFKAEGKMPEMKVKGKKEGREERYKK